MRQGPAPPKGSPLQEHNRGGRTRQLFVDHVVWARFAGPLGWTAQSLWEGPEPWLYQGPRVRPGSRASREGGSSVFRHLSALGSLQLLALATCLSFSSAATPMPSLGAGASESQEPRAAFPSPGLRLGPSSPVYPTHRNPFQSWLTRQGGGVEAARRTSPGCKQSMGKGDVQGED